MKPLRVILVDDHQLIRAGLRLLLESLGNIEVLAELSLGREAIGSVAALKPDLVLLDISLPDISGLEVLAAIEAMGRSAHDPAPTRVLILSMHTQKEYVLRALRAGAVGYLLKESAPEELEAALQSVLAGEQWLSPALRERLHGSALRKSGLDLSPRQTEVLKMIAAGQATREIAAALAISVKTVETHRAQIMEKLAIRDIAGLVRYSVRHGLIEP